MGFGGREFESSRTALQTQLRSEDGRSLGKKERQSRRAKYSPAPFDFKLAACSQKICAMGGAYLASWF
jgi:hypothetical protein